jgi:hypothetical protein
MAAAHANANAEAIRLIKSHQYSDKIMHANMHATPQGGCHANEKNKSPAHCSQAR